jgi:hypothetical protein
MRKNITLQDPYITKKLHSDTIKTVLVSPYQTAYRLYILINNIFESQDFIDTTHEDYWVHATVKTVAAPAGEAKRQIWSITHLQPILRKKPRYIVKCTVTHKQSNKELYKYRLETLNKNQVYYAIDECIQAVEPILSN